MSYAFTIDTKGMRLPALRQLSIGFEFDDLLEQIGVIVEGQVRRRIQEDKTSPEGVPWAAWSEDYARTRKGSKSLLQDEGGLLDSIQYLVVGNEVEVGSNLVYAATHQFGDDGRGIPERPYLGLSPDDEAELDEVLQDFVDGLLAQ